MNGENVLKVWNSLGCPKSALVVLTKSDRWDIFYNLFNIEAFHTVKECFLFTEKDGYWNMLYFDEKGAANSCYHGKNDLMIEVSNNHLLGYLGEQVIGDYPLSFDTLEMHFQEIYFSTQNC